MKKVDKIDIILILINIFKTRILIVFFIKNFSKSKRNIKQPRCTFFLCLVCQKFTLFFHLLRFILFIFWLIFIFWFIFFIFCFITIITCRIYRTITLCRKYWNTIDTFKPLNLNTFRTFFFNFFYFLSLTSLGLNTILSFIRKFGIFNGILIRINNFSFILAINFFCFINTLTIKARLSELNEWQFLKGVLA